MLWITDIKPPLQRFPLSSPRKLPEPHVPVRPSVPRGREQRQELRVLLRLRPRLQWQGLHLRGGLHAAEQGFCGDTLHQK